MYCCKAVQSPVLLFCEVLPELTVFQINVYSLFRSVFYSMYNICTDGSAEKTDKVLFEPHIMGCIYRYEPKLKCTTTCDKEECASRKIDDTSPACVSFMKILQGAHRIKTFFAE